MAEESSRRVLGIPGYIAIRWMMPGFIILCYAIVLYCISGRQICLEQLPLFGTIAYAILLLGLVLSIGLVGYFIIYWPYTCWKRCKRDKIFKKRYENKSNAIFSEGANKIITLSKSSMVHRYNIMHSNVERNEHLSAAAINTIFLYTVITWVYVIITSFETYAWALIIVNIIVFVSGVIFTCKMFSFSYTTIFDYYDYKCRVK